MEKIITPEIYIKPHIRWMIRRDMAQVLNIEQMSFEYPWTEDEFVRNLRERNVMATVAEYNEKIVGYVVYTLNKEYLGIINLAVHPEVRKEGVGRTIINKLKNKLNPNQRTSLELDIREDNLNAHLFFARQGFISTEILKDYYDNGETAYKFKFLHEWE